MKIIFPNFKTIQINCVYMSKEQVVVHAKYLIILQFCVRLYKTYHKITVTIKIYKTNTFFNSVFKIFYTLKKSMLIFNNILDLMCQINIHKK